MKKNHQWMRSGLACLLAVYMAISTVGAAFFQLPISRGQARDAILLAADDYGAASEQILLGYGDGNLGENHAIKRVEACVMIYRAFGSIPLPGSHQSRTMEPLAGENWDQEAVLSPAGEAVPEWAAEAVFRLRQSGILTDGDLSKLSSTMTEEELNLLIRRVWAFLGQNLKDDFYRTVNQRTLDSATFYPGYDSAGPSADASYATDLKLQNIMVNLSEEETDASRRKLYALYASALDTESRERQGIGPIAPWLSAITRANTIEELTLLRQEILQETGVPLLYGISLTRDASDGSRWVLAMMQPEATLEKAFYTAETSSDHVEAYVNYRAELLVLAGFDAEAARAQAEVFYAYESELARAQLDPEAYYNIEESYHMLSLEDISSYLPGLDIKALISGDGYREEGYVAVADLSGLEVFGSCFTQENLALCKTLLRVAVLDAFGPLLHEDFSQVKIEFLSQRYGISLQAMEKTELALSAVKTLMPNELGQIYTKEFVSPEVKKKVTDLIEDILRVWQERIEGIDWLEEATRERMLKKLTSMELMVGYPEDWTSPLDTVEIKSPQQGGTYFENYCTIAKAQREAERLQQGQGVDQNQWHMAVYAVNAYYNCRDNAIVFPVGILQAPYYDPEASLATNLGGIGSIIAHEITHAFDNNGAQYDENGNVSDWWTQADKDTFAEKCQLVVECYEGWEVSSGLSCDGAQTLGENIADIGGMACVLTLLEASQAEPDYKTLFLSYANIWAGTESRGLEARRIETDVHAPRNLRVNRVLTQFDPFYDAFEIHEGDGMYIPPEERITIW